MHASAEVRPVLTYCNIVQSSGNMSPPGTMVRASMAPTPTVREITMPVLMGEAVGTLQVVEVVVMMETTPKARGR